MNKLKKKLNKKQPSIGPLVTGPPGKSWYSRWPIHPWGLVYNPLRVWQDYWWCWTHNRVTSKLIGLVEGKPVGLAEKKTNCVRNCWNLWTFDHSVIHNCSTINNRGIKTYMLDVWRLCAHLALWEKLSFPTKGTFSLNQIEKLKSPLEWGRN